MKIIKYQLMTEVKNAYMDIDGKETEEVTQIFSDVEIRCTAANFESNYAIAEKEAWGEITVEDDGQEETETAPSLENRVASLEESSAEMTETLDMILSGVTEDE